MKMTISILRIFWDLFASLIWFCDPFTLIIFLLLFFLFFFFFFFFFLIILAHYYYINFKNFLQMLLYRFSKNLFMIDVVFYYVFTYLFLAYFLHFILKLFVKFFVIISHKLHFKKRIIKWPQNNFRKYSNNVWMKFNHKSLINFN